MLGQGLEFATSLGFPCGVYDAIEERLGLNVPNQNKTVSRIKRFGVQFFVSGLFCAAPLYATGFVANYIPQVNHFNTSLFGRMIFLGAYNGIGLARHIIETTYNAVKGRKTETIDRIKTACKFGWRFGLEALGVYYSMQFSSKKFAEVVGKNTMIVEGVLLGLCAERLKKGLGAISRFIDDTIIGKTSDERNIEFNHTQTSPNHSVIGCVSDSPSSLEDESDRAVSDIAPRAFFPSFSRQSDDPQGYWIQRVDGQYVEIDPASLPNFSSGTAVYRKVPKRRTSFAGKSGYLRPTKTTGYKFELRFCTKKD